MKMRFGCCAALAALALMPGLAPAQDEPPQNAGEIQSLREQVAQLTSENERLGARIAELEERLTVLLRELAEAQRTISELRRPAPSEQPPPQAEPSAPLPSDPLASPASLLAALQRRCATDLSDLPRQTEAQLETFHTEVQAWCREMSRQMRGRVTWLVLIDPIESADRTDQTTRIAQLTVIDPLTGLAIGDPVRAAIDHRFVRRLENLNKVRFPCWELTLDFAAAPRYNPDREERGVFNSPLFIGPFVEFDYEMQWVGLEGVDKLPSAQPRPSNPR